MTTRPLRTWLLVPLLFGGAGFLANLLHYEIFFNVDFIFGSAFTMLAILLAGAGPGLAAAVVAGSATVVLWNHPWAFTILVAEAACVGWLHSRRSMDLLLADLLFWMVLGAPMVWGLYRHFLHVEAQMAFLVILKQTINGIVNTLLACLAHKIWRARVRSEGIPRPAFRPAVFITLVSLVTFPALLFLAMFLRREIRHEEQILVARSLELDRVSRQTLVTWINDHHESIKALAALEAEPGQSEAERQRAVEILREASPAFLRVGVLDERAIVTAYSPPLDEQGRPILGRDFSDRPYIPILKSTRRPFVADLVMGRVGPRVPIFPLLAPILRDGSYTGYCIGVTDLTRLHGLLLTLSGANGDHVTLVDRNGLVVSSTRPDLPVMSSFRRIEGEVRPLGEGAVHRIPLAQPGQSRMVRWTRSLVIHEELLGPDLPWRVVVELPFAPLIGILTRTSILGLGVLFLLILATVALAHALSRGFTESIGQLEAATRAFPALLEEGPERRLALPSSGIEELHHLARRFEQMAEAMRVSFRELRGLKDTLEARVVTRTAELKAAMDAIKTLQGIIPICASCKKIRDDRGAWNQLEAYISEHTDAAFSHGLCPDCVKRFREEARHTGSGA